MTTSETLEENTVARVVGIKPDSPLAKLIATRADTFALTQTTETAALKPRDPGGLSHAERAALACRMARLNQAEQLAAHYGRDLFTATDTDPILAQIADPATPDSILANARLAALVHHVDKVTTQPREASAADIQALRTAGLIDADIVRLSELIAFVNYQLRLIAGLQLLQKRLGEYT